MMAITGNESTDDLKLLLARRIYTAVVLNSSLLKVKDVSKIHDIENFINILKKRSAWNGIKPFLQHWPCFFSVSEESNTHVIKPIVTIEFCRDFDGKKGCDKAYCSKLHVCRHFVKGKCTFGPRCKKPHHFGNEGTREVLKKHFLDFLTNEQAREFLCRNVQHLLEPDNMNTELPKSLEICKYYNVATGCTREICPYIHVCRFFAEEGNCKFGSQCIRKHDIENAHSRLLLHRYHMEHLSDAQVMAYLKIKGDQQRDQQQQQQQIQLNGQQISKNENPLINSPNVQMTIPQIFPSHFSLPTTSSNGFFGALHGNLTEEINRKLAQVTTQNLASIPIVHESNHTRKLSLPNPAINHNTNILTAQISVEDVDLSHRSLSSQFNNKRNQEKAKLSRSLQDTSNLLGQQHLSPPSSYPNNSCKSHRDDFLKVQPQDNRLGFVQNDISSLNRANDASRANHVNPISRSLTDTLSMFLRNSESPQEYSRFRRESSENYKNVFNRHDVNHYTPHSNTSSPALHHSLSNSNLPNNTHHFNLPEHNFSKSKSFENFKDENNLSLNNNKNLGNNGFSKTQPSFYKPFSTSLQTDIHNMFHSRSFLRSSSSDIISPTDSTSSVNGNTSGRKNFLNGFNHNQQLHDHSLFFGSSDWTENDYKNKSNEDDIDDDLNFLFFRTRSLPNFNATNLEKTRFFDSQLVEDCICQKNQVCVFNLSGECKMGSCLKLHTKETFQWQISSSTQTKTKNGSPTFFSNYLASNNYKKENFDKIKNEWINVEKNENIKLETAFSSCEIDQTVIEFYGVSVTVMFEDMVGIAGQDVLNSTTSVSGSADLSSWLMIQSSGMFNLQK